MIYIIKLMVATLLIITLTGCGGSNPNIKTASSNYSINNHGDILAYALIKDGVLIGIKNEYSKADENIYSVVEIRENSFYPALGVENNIHCAIDRKSYICEDAFYSANVTKTIVSNTLITLFSITDVKTGYVGKKVSFNQALFQEVLEKNNLSDYQEQLQKLYKHAYSRNKEMGIIYKKKHEDYQTNFRHLNLNYIIKDETGFNLSKYLELDYHKAIIKSNQANKKSYDYKSLIKNATFNVKNFQASISKIRSEIDSQATFNNEEYRKYLATKYSAYTLKLNDYTLKINEHLSINVENEFSPTIMSINGISQTIDIIVKIKSANFENIFPMISLKDENINVNLEYLDTQISAIATNKTNIFLTFNSLSIYYNSNVNTVSNLNREIAPQSSTLKNGSSYAIISNKISNQSSYKNLTYNKAEKINIDYGFALKYKIVDTSREKSIFKQNKYVLNKVLKGYI